MAYDKLGTTSPASVTDTGAAAAGSSTEVSKKDHTHALAVAGIAVFAGAVPSTFANGRRLVNGTNTTVNTSVAGQVAIDATGGGGGPSPSSTDPDDVGNTPSAGVSAEYSRGDHVHGDPAVARWDLADMRYFLLDPDGGNDANTGFTDATPGATIAPGSLPKATWAALSAIIPPNGNGRLAKILIKNRAAGATIAEAMDLAGFSGYAWFGKCGSSDLSNDATDRIKAGGVTFLAGGGGGGEWTVATVTSGNEITVTGTIPAGSDDGWGDSVVGCRVRFTGNVTGALANACGTIWHATAGAGATVNFTSLPATPAPGDTFLIEAPGVNFRSFRDVDAQQAYQQVGAPPFATEMISPTVGIATNETSSPNFGNYLVGGMGAMHYAFCGARGSSLPAFAKLATQGHVDTLSFASSYVDEEGNEVTVGGNRFAGSVDVTCERLKVRSGGFNLSSGGEVSGFDELNIRADLYDWQNSDNEIDPCVLAQGANVYVGSGAGFQQIIGVRVQNRDERDGALELWMQGASLYLAEVDVMNVGSAAHSAVKVHNPNPAGSTRSVGGSLVIAAVVAVGGSTPRTLVDVSEATGLELVIDGSSDAGADGGIRMDGGDLAGDILVPLGFFSNTNIVDVAGNNVTQSAGLSRVLKCVPVVNDTEASIAQGQVLQPNGNSSISGVPYVVEASSSAAASSAVLGVSAMTIPADGGVGFAVVAGVPYVASDLSASVGQPVYLSSSSGGVTATAPARGSGLYKNPLGAAVAAHAITWTPKAIGELVPLEESLSGDAQDIDFLGLNGDVDQAYRVRVWGQSNGGDFVVKYNGGGTRSAIWSRNNGTTVVAGADPELGGTGFFAADDTFALEMVFNLQRQSGGAGPICRFTLVTEDIAGANAKRVDGVVVSGDIGNITSIKLNGSTATFWNAGVNYSIERVPPG